MSSPLTDSRKRSKLLAYLNRVGTTIRAGSTLRGTRCISRSRPSDADTVDDQLALIASKMQCSKDVKITGPLAKRGNEDIGQEPFLSSLHDCYGRLTRR